MSAAREAVARGIAICDGSVQWEEVVPVTDYLKRGF